MAKFDIKEYARRGAEARAAELVAELNDIYRAFPGLRRGRGRISLRRQEQGYELFPVGRKVHYIARAAGRRCVRSRRSLPPTPCCGGIGS